jgi:hypothetical protein
MNDYWNEADNYTGQRRAALISDPQWVRLAQWSYQHGQSVPDILACFRLEQYSSGPTGTLTGTIPGCGLFGGLCADGSTHT